MLKIAVTLVLASSVTVHGLVPGQPATLQPANVEPVAGAAVMVTCVPLVKLTQPVPHELPEGEVVNVPLPVPDAATVRLTGGALFTVTVTVEHLSAAARSVRHTLNV